MQPGGPGYKRPQPSTYRVQHRETRFYAGLRLAANLSKVSRCSPKVTRVFFCLMSAPE